MRARTHRQGDGPEARRPNPHKRFGAESPWPTSRGPGNAPFAECPHPPGIFALLIGISFCNWDGHDNCARKREQGKLWGISGRSLW